MFISCITIVDIKEPCYSIKRSLTPSTALNMHKTNKLQCKIENPLIVNMSVMECCVFLERRTNIDLYTFVHNRVSGNT